MLIFGTAAAHADFKLCNRMSYVVDVAIGIDDKGTTATRGWWRIDPAQCRVVAQGTLTADRILLHARALGVYGSSPVPQNGSDNLCIAKDNFVIAAARQCRRGQTAVPFTEIKPSQGDDGNLVAYLADPAMAATVLASSFAAALDSGKRFRNSSRNTEQQLGSRTTIGVPAVM